MRGRLFLVLLVSCTCWTYSVGAAENPRGDQLQAPVEVTADRLEADETAGTVAFVGNAVAVQGGLTIHADRLTILYVTDSREVERVIAAGEVRILQENREATGDKAVFNRGEQTITLTGSPAVREGQSYVQGEEVVLFLDERRSIVRGGTGGRVNAVFQPPPKERP